MSLDFHFVQVVKTRDAIAVYVYLSRQGNIGETSYERLALALKTAGLQTSRGADFTAAVVRSKLAALQEIGAVSLEKVSKNSFRISLTTNADDEEPKDAESQDNSESVENQNDSVEQNEESPRARGEEVLINNNKNINKKINKTNQEILTTEEKASVVVENLVEDVKENAQPSTDELRERIDWNQPKVAAYRASIVQQCWEPGINPDLIDRVAALAILKIDGFDSKRVAVILREASEQRALYERTAGRYGSPTLWKPICYAVKRIYEGSGWKWTATRIANEPKPTVAPRVAVPQGIDARKSTVENAIPSEPASATSSASSAVYTDEECLGDFDSLAQLIRSREGLSQWEAQGRAYALRSERRNKQRMSV